MAPEHKPPVLPSSCLVGEAVKTPFSSFQSETDDAESAGLGNLPKWQMHSLLSYVTR